MKVYRKIASLLQARENCKKSQSAEWFNKHTDSIEEIVEKYLPSGSGIDSGVKIDWDDSNPGKIVLLTSFHHMDEWGGYDGWTDHKVIITPSLANGMEMRITGRNRNDIKEYLYQVFESCLNQEME